MPDCASCPLQTRAAGLNLNLQYASTHEIRGDAVDKSSVRRTGQIALASGLLGLLGVALLIAALAAPTPAQNSMRRATSFFAWQNAAVVIQALTMIPVTLGLHRYTMQSKPERGLLAVSIGLFGQITLILAAGLLFTGTVSDMLYMAPIGLVGLWLVLINSTDEKLFSRALARTGTVAGIGLLLIGIGFLIYGVVVAPAVFIRPLSNAELDAQSLTIPNLVAHICMAIGTIAGRLIYPVWTSALGRRMMRLAAA